MKRLPLSILFLLCLLAPASAHRMVSGTTDEYVYFVAVDATDYKTRETGLSSFTVYYSLNGAAAVAVTTPTVNETDGTNMPGVYELLIDEAGMTTLAAGDDTGELCLHITQASMAPVTRVIEIYRAKATAGETMTVASGLAAANMTQLGGSATPVTNLNNVYNTDYATAFNEPNGVFNVRLVDVSKAAGLITEGTGSGQISLTNGTVTVGTNSDKSGYSLAADQSAVTIGTVTTLTGHTAQTGDSYAEIGTAGAGLTALGDTRLANLDAAITTRSSHAAADVKTTLEADGSKIDHVWETTEDDGGVRRFTENALEQAPSGTGGDATAANQTTIINHLTDVKGTAFVKDTSSLPQCLTATSVTVSEKTGFSLGSPQTFDLTGDITGNLSGSVGSVTGGATAANQTTIVTHLTDVKGPTWSAATDQLEDIRDRGDAAWTTGAGTGLTPLASGTAQAGAGSSITLAAGTGNASKTLIGAKIAIHTGTGAGQTNYVIAYDATSKIARTLSPWFVTPDATSEYEIIPGEGRILEILLGKR
ncbi:MAG TPA: hypothetical protein VM238_22960 [Phycisphaerae bacterium]|nr:hypothetical protein [Phycisphaerae bacterium]